MRSGQSMLTGKTKRAGVAPKPALGAGAAAAGTPAVAPKASGVVLRTLTEDERNARAHALADARLREREERERASPPSPASLSVEKSQLAFDKELSEIRSALESLGRKDQDQTERQNQDLHHALRQLHAQNAGARERERDMREMLARTQTELEKLRRAYEASQTSMLRPSDLAKDSAPTADATMRRERSLFQRQRTKPVKCLRSPLSMRSKFDPAAAATTSSREIGRAHV